MTNEEITDILSRNNAVIIAPAGHGKTEMIVDLVEKAKGKQLLLTHTNAGVDALEKRLKKRNVSHSKYSISTIAAFCIKWCMSYFQNASFDTSLSPQKGREETRRYYAQLYVGTYNILRNKWPGEVLGATYSGIIVDEYQDCTQDQHKIILALNHFLPVRVLGDPLQGIFAFAGPIVDWNTLEFQRVDIHTEPWRWIDTNPELGKYLTKLRESLSPVLRNVQCEVEIPCCTFINMISREDVYGLYKKLLEYKSVVYITKWEKQQLEFCKRMPVTKFQHDEKQECDVLFEFAKKCDSSSECFRVLSIIEFVDKCATNVTVALRSYISHLENNNCDFSRVRKYPELGALLSQACRSHDSCTLLSVLKWFDQQHGFRFYRLEMYKEMIRGMKYAIDNNSSITDGIKHIRFDPNLLRRYSSFKYISSRTVLSKGLEFDCVIIDMIDYPLSAKDFYVAMTRAKKMIYIISNNASLSFSE